MICSSIKKYMLYFGFRNKKRVYYSAKSPLEWIWLYFFVKQSCTWIPWRRSMFSAQQTVMQLNKREKPTSNKYYRRFEKWKMTSVVAENLEPNLTHEQRLLACVRTKKTQHKQRKSSKAAPFVLLFSYLFLLGLLSLEEQMSLHLKE